MPQEPRGLLGDAEILAELDARDSLRASQQQEGGDQPLLQRQVAALHHRAGPQAEVALAVPAAIGACGRSPERADRFESTRCQADRRPFRRSEMADLACGRASRRVPDSFYRRRPPDRRLLPQAHRAWAWIRARPGRPPPSRSAGSSARRPASAGLPSSARPRPRPGTSRTARLGSWLETSRRCTLGQGVLSNRSSRNLGIGLSIEFR